MRKRNVAILFRLNRKEAEALDKKVKKSDQRRGSERRPAAGLLFHDEGTPPDRE